MNRIRQIGIGARPLLSAMFLFAMAFSLSGCPAIEDLLGDAPFNGVYCDENAAGCPDREREDSSDTINSDTPADPAPANPNPT